MKNVIEQLLHKHNVRNISSLLDTPRGQQVKRSYKFTLKPARKQVIILLK
jgi:hypothetical protein